ncbi:hypothetical protein B0H10DRAFT_2088664 [Mycena sp. CBHHK59/15]|nr:hypothetical protein B0H10DRAFT_2088664 [Mycena sp. CBHHK59/15]
MLPECQAILVPVTREKTPASASISTPGAPDTIVLPTARGTITALAARFASHIPTGEFSTAELQCYLQGYKIHPAEAVMDAAAWVAEQRAERKAREAREVERKQRARERRGQMLAAGVGMQTLGVPMPMKAMPMQMQTIPMQSQPTPMQILGAGEGEDTRLVVDHARAREEGKWSLTQGSASGSEVSSYINGAFPAESAMDLEAPASVR